MTQFHYHKLTNNLIIIMIIGIQISVLYLQDTMHAHWLKYVKINIISHITHEQKNLKMLVSNTKIIKDVQ